MYWLDDPPSGTRETSQSADCFANNKLGHVGSPKAAWSLAEDGDEEGGTENPSGTGIAEDTSEFQHPHPSYFTASIYLALGNPLILYKAGIHIPQGSLEPC